MNNEITRIWKDHETGLVLLLRHFPLTDSKSLLVNGVEVPFQLEYNRNGCSKVNFQFEYGNKKPGLGSILINLPQASFNLFVTKYLGMGCPIYTCVINPGEKTLIENNSLQPILGLDVTTYVSGLQVVDYVVDGEKNAWYRVIWKERNVNIHHRFRDFYFLYNQVGSALRGTHFYSSLPEPPPKETPFVDHHVRFL